MPDARTACEDFAKAENAPKVVSRPDPGAFSTVTRGLDKECGRPAPRHCGDGVHLVCSRLRPPRVHAERVHTHTCNNLILLDDSWCSSDLSARCLSFGRFGICSNVGNSLAFSLILRLASFWSYSMAVRLLIHSQRCLVTSCFVLQGMFTPTSKCTHLCRGEKAHYALLSCA